MPFRDTEHKPLISCVLLFPRFLACLSSQKKIFKMSKCAEIKINVHTIKSHAKGST